MTRIFKCEWSVCSQKKVENVVDFEFSWHIYVYV